MIFDDKPHDHCGIFGIFGPKEDVSQLTYYGLLALQHRGQESAGIASSNFKNILVHKGMGLVNQVFTESILKRLDGKIAIGHTRYSTAGSSILKNAQPLILASNFGDFALAHNGNLANYKELRNKLLKKGHCFNTEVDSEVIARVIINSKGKNLKSKIISGISIIKGAFSLLILTKNKLFVIRDQWGIRPLVLGRINSQGWIAASESTAIESVGGKVIRDVRPGEFIEISKNGLNTFHEIKNKNGGFCIFEYIYFSRPDSVINGNLVHLTRREAGILLAKQKITKADYVISVPDSGTSAALGFSQQSRIPFQEGLIKSRYIGRTFIQPDQRIRNLGVRLKFSPLSQALKNKEIVLVDDSIVRGTTIAQIVNMLKKSGVKKIHLRIVSPPFKHICYLGVDVARYKELIAAKNSPSQIKEKLKVDSLEYLSLSNLKKAISNANYGFCTGCFNKDYPT